MSKHKRTWFPLFLVIGVSMLMLAAGVFARRAEAVVTIECEILVEDSNVLMPGQAPFAVVATNVVEDGEGAEGEAVDAPWPGDVGPVIIYIDPISGGEGVVVTIYGYNFTEVNNVLLTADGVTVVVPPDAVNLAGVDEETGVPDGYDEIVFTTPAPPLATGGAVDVTVSTTTALTFTLPGGFFYIIPSPYPGLPGSSTLRWVEVVVSTNILDGFSSQIAALDPAPTDAELLALFRDYLDSVLYSLTLWVDGYSGDEAENGFFSSEDRPLTPLLDLNGDGSIDITENQSAEVYENFIPGSRARVFSFARNTGLGAMLRAAATYSTGTDPPITIGPDWLLPRDEVVAGEQQTMDQIVYRFACAWDDHNAVQQSGSGFFEIGPLFEIPRLGWPPINPGADVGGRIPEHVSNQYIGGSGDGDDDSELFIGNDYFVTFQPGCAYPASAVLNFRVSAETPEIVIPPPGYPATPPGMQTDPPPEAFDGCETEASIGGAEGTNFGIDVVTMASGTEGEQAYSVPRLDTRPRPDRVDGLVEGWYLSPSLPTIRAMEYPTAVLGVHAHGGDPSEMATSVFPDRITITFTDVGGGVQFGRLPANTFAGDGDFNPWFGLDNMSRQHGYRGVDFYRDSDNDGVLDPESDDVYASSPLIIENIANAWEPYYFIRNPGNGVAQGNRDDPEWTIMLDLTSRSIYRSPRVPDRDPEPMDDGNFADFALESPLGADGTPDFFVAIQLDSGFKDSPGAGWQGDGTGIRYGADFRVYVKPALVTGVDDQLHDLAQQGELGKFPGGMIFSNQQVSAGGLGCEMIETTMPEQESPPHHAVMQTRNYVMTVGDASNPFSQTYFEGTPFFGEADFSEAGGPRSPFFPEPPTFFGPDADPPISDFTWWLPLVPPQWPPLTLLEERNFFEDAIGHRLLAQRVDSLSLPTPVLALNIANTIDAETLASNDMKVAVIECFLVSEDHRGTTGFEPSDLLEIADDGLGETGISLWLDVGSNGWFDAGDDTQIPLMLAEIGTVPEPINMDGIDQGVPDLWGYRVVLQPGDAFNVPLDDDPGGDSEGDDLYIAIQTSDTISYKDKIEVVIPHGGVTFHPTGISAPSGTIRYARTLAMPLPIEVGDASPASDNTRFISISQLLTNVPTELTSLVRTNFDTDADGVADAQSIGPAGEYEVLGIDVATLNADAEVYLEYLTVEFYNQGLDEDGDGRPDDEDFAPSIDLLPFTADSATSGIGLYRDNPNNKNGVFSSDDIPIQFDDPPDLVGVSGEVPLQVRMAFSSPGTDDVAGTVDPLSGPSAISLAEQTAFWAAYADGAFGRQLVPTTFGRNESGGFIGGHEDAGDDFFVVIRTSDTLGLADDFTVGIISWGPDTLTGVDADTFTAPPAPWQPSDEYEKFEQAPWASRGIGFIELVTDTTPPEPRAYTNDGGFNFLRTRATVQLETDVLYATSGVVDPIGPVPPPPPPPPPPGPATAVLGGGGGGGGGCLIATAAFGTRYEEHVVALTTFRDRYLLTNAAGAWLVKRYYSLSPRLAEFVARHEVVRAVLRQIIRPVSAVARLCIETSAAGKTAILFGAALLVAALIKTRRTWRSVRVRV